MYGLVFNKGTQTVAANLGRIDRAATGIFFREQLGALHGVAFFDHAARDGSIVATAGDLRVEVIVDEAEAAYFQTQRFWDCGTLTPGRVRPTWEQVADALRATKGDALRAATIAGDVARYDRIAVEVAGVAA